MICWCTQIKTQGKISYSLQFIYLTNGQENYIQRNIFLLFQYKNHELKSISSEITNLECRVVSTNTLYNLRKLT